MATASADHARQLGGTDKRGDMELWRRYLTGPRGGLRVAPQRKLRTLDLFSGVGGLALGFARVAQEHGAEVLSTGAVDTDSGAVDVYERNLGTQNSLTGSVSSLVDFQVRGRGSTARFLYAPELTTRAPSSFHGVDVVLAGPPCQGHSSLNNKTRGNDDRNRLYLAVAAVAVATEAEIVIIENVPGVIHARENVVSTASHLLKEAGYAISSGVVAADALGWPQTRKRFFLVATRTGVPTPLLQLAVERRREPLPVSWAIEDLLDRKQRDFMDEVADISPENSQRIAWLFENDEYDMPLHLRPDCHKDGTSYGAVYGRMRWDAPAPTVTTGFLTPGRGRFIHPRRPRTITAREAARIQGFPDWFHFGGKGSEPPARRDLAKWIGNAVPPILGHLAGSSAFGVDA